MAVQVNGFDINVFRTPILCPDGKRSTVGKVEFHARNAGRAQFIFVAAGADGIEPHAIEEVPGAHLATVVVAAERSRLVAVEMVGHVADPLLAILRLTEFVKQVQHMVAGLISVPVTANPAPDVVRARDVLIHLHGEHILQPFQQEVTARHGHIGIEIVRNRPRILHGKALGDIAPAIHGTGALVGDGSKGRTPLPLRVASTHVLRLRIVKITPIAGTVQEESIVLFVA